MLRLLDIADSADFSADESPDVDADVDAVSRADDGDKSADVDADDPPFDRANILGPTNIRPDYPTFARAHARAGMLRRAPIYRNRGGGRHDVLRRPLAVGRHHDERTVYGGLFGSRRGGAALPRLQAGGD